MSGEPRVSGEQHASDAPGFDITVPHVARMYNYWLGGKDNFPADRAAGDLAVQVDPAMPRSVRANRAFLARVTRFLAAEAGIRQFLDIGTGLPSANNTHEVAQAIAPDSRIVYVDSDPIVLSHARALLTSTPEGQCRYLDADLRDTAAILGQAAQTLDFSRPVAVMLIAVMHCIPDPDDPDGIMTRLKDALPPGSFLALSHPARDLNATTRERMSTQVNAMMRTPVTLRDRTQVVRFFDGLELIEPGVVVVPEWRPVSELEASSPAWVWGGVGRKR
ncbi:MAG: SAM-dependent methyltransferase [Streptosporangiaceae bacterium]